MQHGVASRALGASKSNEQKLRNPSTRWHHKGSDHSPLSYDPPMSGEHRLRAWGIHRLIATDPHPLSHQRVHVRLELLHGIWFCTHGLISNATTNAAWIASNPTPTSTGTMSTFLDQGGGRLLRRRTRKNGTNGKRRWVTRSYSDSAKGTISALLGLPELRFLRRYTKRIGSRL
jgi:hypothetical protein